MTIRFAKRVKEESIGGGQTSFAVEKQFPTTLPRCNARQRRCNHLVHSTKYTRVGTWEIKLPSYFVIVLGSSCRSFANKIVRYLNQYGSPVHVIEMTEQKSAVV